MPAGYSGTPLIKKLGVKDGMLWSAWPKRSSRLKPISPMVSRGKSVWARETMRLQLRAAAALG